MSIGVGECSVVDLQHLISFSDLPFHICGSMVWDVEQG